MADDPWAGFADAPAPQAAPQAAPAPAVVAAAQPGGGADPWAGFADAPAPSPTAPPLTIKPAAPANNAAAAAVSGAIDGVPVVGPYLLGGMQRLSAFQRSMDKAVAWVKSREPAIIGKLGLSDQVLVAIGTKMVSAAIASRAAVPAR